MTRRSLSFNVSPADGMLNAACILENCQNKQPMIEAGFSKQHLGNTHDDFFWRENGE